MMNSGSPELNDEAILAYLKARGIGAKELKELKAEMEANKRGSELSHRKLAFSVTDELQSKVPPPVHACRYILDDQQGSSLEFHTRVIEELTTVGADAHDGLTKSRTAESANPVEEHGILAELVINVTAAQNENEEALVLPADRNAPRPAGSSSLTAPLRPTQEQSSPPLRATMPGAFPIPGLRRCVAWADSSSTGRDRDLSQAIVVGEAAIVTENDEQQVQCAEPWEDDAGFETKMEARRRLRPKRTIMTMILAFIAALVAAVVALTLTLRPKSVTETTAPTTAPSAPPSLTPDVRLELLMSVLAPFMSPASLLMQEGTPQHTALIWLNDEDPIVLIPSFDTDERIRQRYALAVLYHATGGPSVWVDGEAFLTGVDECDLDYSVCDEQGKLNSLILSKRKLEGRIPNEIFRIQSLEELVLDSNKLTGIELRNSNFTSSIKILDLSSNVIGGTILRDFFSVMTTLEFLNVDTNIMNGTIPSEIRNMVKLTGLNIEANEQLSGTIPSELFQLGKIEKLLLRDTNLGGTIPIEFSRMKKLKELRLRSDFFGTIPTELGTMTNLKRLHVSSKVLTGVIPSEIGLLTKLTRLHFAKSLSLGGTVPQEIANLTALERLHMEDTALTGSINFLCTALDGTEMRVGLQDVVCDCCACCA